MQPTLFGEVQVRHIGAPVAAANNTNNRSDRIDMAGYEGVMFIATVTTATANGVATARVEQNDVNSDSGMAAIAGAAAIGTSVSTGDLNNRLLVVDVFRPRERYLSLVRTSAAANIAFGPVIAILYGPKTKPTIDHASLIAKAAVTSAPEA